MEPGHLLHSALASPLSANSWRLKPRHPFVPATQQLISSSDNNNNIHAAQWADCQWNAEWVDNPTRLRIAIFDTGTHPPRIILPWRAWVWLNPHRYRTFPSLLVQMGYGFLCDLWVWRRRTSRRPCCPPMSNPSSISSWTARPDGSGRWNNRMAAQRLPRYLLVSVACFFTGPWAEMVQNAGS